MDENLEIYFCEICSESVPLQDVQTKAAVEYKGKTIGACCLPDLRGIHSKSGSLGMTTLGVVLLLAVAGATVFLNWRLTDEIQGVNSDVGQVSFAVASQGSQWADLERRFDESMRQDALPALDLKVGSLATRVSDGEERILGELRGSHTRFALLEETHKRMLQAQNEIRQRVEVVNDEVTRLARDFAAAIAAPPPEVGAADAGEAVRVPGGAMASLTPALAHQVARLQEEDPGARFEAVDNLVQSKDPAVQEFLLPMLKDRDAFVRRLTAEGLAHFPTAPTVDALIVALADGESIVRYTAHATLKRLTEQAIPFDADGSETARAEGQRRWQTWWEKNREKF